jgi:hypothetical protein
MKRKPVYNSSVDAALAASRTDDGANKSRRGLQPLLIVVGVGASSIVALFYLIFFSGLFKATDSFERFVFDEQTAFVRSDDYEFDCNNIARLNITDEVLQSDKRFEIVRANFEGIDYAFKRVRQRAEQSDAASSRLPRKLKRPSRFLKLADLPPSESPIEKNIIEVYFANDCFTLQVVVTNNVNLLPSNFPFQPTTWNGRFGRRKPKKRPSNADQQYIFNYSCLSIQVFRLKKKNKHTIDFSQRKESKAEKRR